MWIAKGTSFSIFTGATSLYNAGSQLEAHLPLPLFTRHRKTTGTNHVYIRMNNFLLFFTAFGRIIVIQVCAFCPSCANIITADVSSKKLTRQKINEPWKKIVKLYLNNLHLFHVRYSAAVYFKKGKALSFPIRAKSQRWTEVMRGFQGLFRLDAER